MSSYEPAKFADPEYARRYGVLFDEYVELRVRGIPRDLAIIQAFELIKNGMDLSNVDQLAMAAEVNAYVRQRIDEVLEAKVARTELWTKNRAVHNLLKIVEDHRERGSTRLSAIQSLNALCGYIQLDEDTTNLVHQTVADFLRQNALWEESGRQTTTAH